MLTDDAIQAEGTETEAAGPTGDGAVEAASESSPSFDWESATKAPEWKDKVREYLSQDEEFRKEAARGVRLTDVEKRAAERAAELAAADRKRAEELQAQLDEVREERERAKLSTMTLDEQEVYKLQKRAEAAEAKVAEHETERSVREAEKAREDIIAYAQREWGLDDDAAEELRASKDGTDLMDRALKAATKQRAKDKAELEALRTKASAQGRVLDGTSTFAATGSSAAGGEMSDDEVMDQYHRTGPSSPNYDRVRQAAERVLRKRGWI